jgi:hypothetical protein
VRPAGAAEPSPEIEGNAAMGTGGSLLEGAV